MNSFFWVLFLIFTFSAIAQSIKIEDNQIILSAKSCSEVASEVFSIWNKQTHDINCECRSGICSSVINGILPEKMEKLILHTYNENEGPNCWNSVLYLNGMSPGLLYSENEIEFWYNSPLCKLITPGEPMPGDIINFTARGKSIHSTRLLSKNILFNKANGDITEPYEARNLNDYLKELGVKPSCRNVTLKQSQDAKCSHEYSVYRCSNFEDYVSDTLDKEFFESQSTIKKSSECFTNYYLENENNLPENLSDSLKVINKLAIEKLKIPTQADLPDEIKTYFSKLYGEADYASDIIYYSLLSQSDMDVSSHVEREKAVVDLFRKYKIYDYKPTKDFLMWSQVYLTTKSQLQELGPK